MSWVFFTEKVTLTGMGCFSEVFLEENIVLDIVSRKHISCDYVYFLCLCKVKKTIGRFQLEVPGAIAVSRFLAYVSVWIW